MAEPGYLDTLEAQQPSPARKLRLLSRLQTTLDPAEVLRIYFSELHEWLGVDGLTWTDRTQRLRWGRAARYRYDYALHVEGQALGELSVSNGQRLGEEAVRRLEESTGLLIHPLRNALLYREALRAALRDPLTGLGNRSDLEASLRRELELARRHDTALALIVLDIDHFKSINDLHGHCKGDEVLRRLAALLRDRARGGDLLFRFAGDEFVVVMRHTDRDSAVIVAERLRRQVMAGDFGVPLRITLGVAAAEPEDTPQALFRRADEALLAAKRAGRNRVDG